MHKIGLIGLDTSHVTAFTQLLHDATDPHHIPGFRVTAAFPGGSPGFELSRTRLAGFTEELRSKQGVAIVPSIADLPGDLDAYFLESVDGRQHLDQFRAIAARGKPVFIDKPLAASTADARAILALAADCGTPVMSCSALRYAETFEAALSAAPGGPVSGADFFGPMPFIAELPGYFWYGIHAAEMLYRAFGVGARRVHVASNDHADVITAEWHDGRLATIRGHRSGNTEFGGTLFRPQTCLPFRINAGKVPFYASLLGAVARFVDTGHSPIAAPETLEIIQFLAAANLSRERREWVSIG